MEDQPMKLTEEEREKLLKAKDEKAWYEVCDEIKDRRNGQYPAYLSREVLELFQEKFPVTMS
ncbi:MAG: hypothetical protein QF472_05765 [Candidatus Marinimicrobia bacterium]|jgi:hypothetical protein|nr:hypothetical protein [Candidatus Neomarinimicrobiota bacterium]|tara:strand:- start:115 stop:300 length:186 start_codon:yes stop_codon:yes gene_type:complete